VFPSDDNMVRTIFDGSKMRESTYFQPKCAALPGNGEFVFVGDFVKVGETLCRIDALLSQGGEVHLRGRMIVRCGDFLLRDMLDQDPSLSVWCQPPYFLLRFPLSSPTLLVQADSWTRRSYISLETCSPR